MKTLKASIGIVLFVVVLSLFAAGNTDADILVYDADGQYLGILASTTTYAVTFYMPSIELFAHMHAEGTIDRVPTLYYESDNCTGQPYMYNSASPTLYLINGKYWQAEKVAPISIYRGSILPKFFDRHNNECQKYPALLTSGMVPVIEAPPPPFTFPLALPLSFEVEKKHRGRR